MVKLADSELVALIEEAIDRYVSSRSVNPDSVSQSVAHIIVQSLHRAGAIVVREEPGGPGSGAPRRGAPATP